MIAAAVILIPAPSSADPSLGQLNSQLGHEQTRQHALSSSIGSLSRTIGSLDGQIALVRSRENAVRLDLARDRAALARIRVLLVREQRLVTQLRTRLARAKLLLARQLVSSYEGDRPDLVGVVLEAHGFNDLLNKIAFLRRAERRAAVADQAHADRQGAPPTTPSAASPSSR